MQLVLSNTTLDKFYNFLLSISLSFISLSFYYSIDIIFSIDEDCMISYSYCYYCYSIYSYDELSIVYNSPIDFLDSIYFCLFKKRD